MLLPGELPYAPPRKSFRERLRNAFSRRNADRFVLGLHEGIGSILGGVGGLATFVIVYILAIDSAGWVVGIALGWVVAGLATAAVFLVLRYLWPFALLFAIYLANHWH